MLSIDDFNKPKILKDNDAVAVLLVRLILLEPGTLPTHPTLGVGVISRFRYCDTDKLLELENVVKQQIQVFIPEFANVQVKAESKGKELYIRINIAGITYQLVTDFDKGTVSLTDMINK